MATEREALANAVAQKRTELEQAEAALRAAPEKPLSKEEAAELWFRTVSSLHGNHPTLERCLAAMFPAKPAEPEPEGDKAA
jgi:hypothetical protein